MKSDSRSLRALAAALALLAAPALAEFTCELSFPSSPSTALANFPVLVRLAEGAPTGFSYADCPTGGCLWFTDANDDPIPCDIDTWDDEGESLVWVSVPSLSDAATVTMHWDAAGAPAGLPAASAVWTRANYNAVWHFSGDATESANGLVPNLVKNNPTYVVNADGGIGKVLWLSGSQTISYANDAAWATLGVNDSLTITLMAHPNTASLGAYARMVCCQTDWTVKNGYTFAVHNPIGKITLGSSDSSELAMAANEWSGWPANDWVHFAAVYDNTTGKIFVDGVSKKTGSIKKLYTPEQNLCLGANGDANQRYWNGGLDEIRIRAAASSAEWVAEEYATMTNAAYCSFGPVAEGAETLRIGAPEISDVSPTGAVVTATLRTLGEGADSAGVWLVYTDGTATNSVSLGTKSSVPAALSATLSTLAANTAYACWFTATNNAAPPVGAVSAMAAFKTKRAPSGGNFYCELSFPAAPATALANFPVLVRISEAGLEGFSYADCPESDCLWFTDENDDLLPFDVDTWNDQGESLVWVSVPSLSSATKISMNWSAAGGEDSPAATLVWSRAGYVGVWHMNEILEDSGLHYTPDASGSGWNAYKANEADGYPVTISDAGIANSAPPTGHAMVNQLNDNNRTTGGFVVPSTLTSGTTIGPFTVSLFEASVNTQNDRVFAIGGTRANLWENGCLTAGASTTYVMSPNSGHGSFNYDDGLSQNAWRHIAGIFNTTLGGYVGGVYKDPKKSGVNPVTTLNYGLGLGTFVNHTETFRGNLDEIRIRNVASTGEWIAEEYKTVTTADYVSFGEVEGGSGSIEVLRLGAPSVSDITAVSATVSGRLTKLGDGATSASVSLHYTDGGAATNTVALGSTNAVPAEFTAPLANLTPSTAYTVWFSAVNNAETPASTNSVATVFSTGADATEWDTATATFTPDGRTISATVDITNVGSGTSTLYLLTGSSAAAATTVSGSVPVTSAGTKTVTADLSDKPWGSRVYYSLMLVNGTEANAVTNTYNPNAYKDLQDNSTYTWIGGVAGVWTNTACWNRTAAGNLAANHPAGYPVRGSKAFFAPVDGAERVVVTLPATPGSSLGDGSDPACWYVGELHLPTMDQPLVFTCDTTNWTSRLYVRGFGFNATKNFNRLVFDHCAAGFYAPRFLGDASADANGENFTIAFTNGASGNLGNWNLERPGVKLRVADGSRVIAGAFSAGSSAAPGPVFEVDDAAFSVSGQYGISQDTHGGNGMLIRLSGADASLAASYITPGKTDSTNVVEFVIPGGTGYNAVPLNITRKQNNDVPFGGDGTKAPITLRISRDSPGLGSIPRRGIQLVQAAKGVNVANLRFVDVRPAFNGFYFKDADGNKYGGAGEIAAAGKTAADITQIWYRPPSGGTVLVVK
ncbi:MAG: hypothetical protein II839_08930 [Kiritimatiellae bacterium]|nr:hypothetical protein [Kiritimatiellia bacterium]